MTTVRVSLLLLLVCCVSCKKNVAGGKSQIEGKVAHHSKNIGGAMVYIKYNAKEFPGRDFMKYDTYVKADATGNYSFHCYKGDYYLYAYGTDTLAEPTPVDGGLPVHVRTKEIVKADIALSELH
jgi:hypothetical protein